MMSNLLDFARCGRPCEAPLARRSLCRSIQHVLLGLLGLLQLLLSNTEVVFIKTVTFKGAGLKRERQPTLSSFSFSFSEWWISHCSCTYSRNFLPLTRNSWPCSCSQLSIWAFRIFSSWNQQELANWARCNKLNTDCCVKMITSWFFFSLCANSRSSEGSWNLQYMSSPAFLNIEADHLS